MKRTAIFALVCVVIGCGDPGSETEPTTCETTITTISVHDTCKDASDCATPDDECMEARCDVTGRTTDKGMLRGCYAAPVEPGTSCTYYPSTTKACVARCVATDSAGGPPIVCMPTEPIDCSGF